MTRGLDFKTLTFPFTNGLNQKADTRANQMPALDVALDVQADEFGALQTRYPFTALGSTQSNVRKIVSYGDEQLMFTKDTLYSRSSSTSAWVSRATHLAVAVDETTRFAGRSDQTMCDRAELNNTILYCWTETVDSLGTTVDVGYVAAIDKTTGAVIMSPRTMSSSGLGGPSRRLRLVALSTKILLFFMTADGAALLAYTIDPANPSGAAYGSATTILAAASMNSYYDVVKDPNADAAIVVARRDTTTSYEIIRVTAALALTTSTKARTCDGPVAVACSAGQGTLIVARADGTSIVADEITTSTLVDTANIATAIGTATGTPVNQITAAFRSVEDAGEYRCYIFWDAEESSGASTQRVDGFGTEYNWVDTAVSTGAESVFVAGLGIGSRAFDHDGRVYVNLTHDCASPVESASVELQNTYFLYRDDATLVGKAAAVIGGGYSPATGHLPGVASLGSNRYAWCATERRRIALKDFGVPDFTARAPRDCVIEFDTNRARRTARLGKTLYVTGAEIKQYDGVQLVEVGFHTYLWAISVGQGSAGAGLTDGLYSYTGGYRWDNAQGERDRSAPIYSIGLPILAGPDDGELTNIPPVRATHKTGIAVEIWRTKVDPLDDSPFYLVSNPDPSDRTTPNEYLQNPDPDDPAFVIGATAFSDQMTDAVAAVKESSTDELESVAPPPATIIAASDTRLFLAGVAGDPHRVWYSKQRQVGQVAGFHEALTIDIPHAGGDITALAFLNETLVVFRETAIYRVGGLGFDNTGGGFNYGPAELVSVDIGAVSAEAVGTLTDGLFFKSSKGWYLLNRGWGLDYVGAGVADYDSESPVGVHVVESQHQVRCLTASRLLVFDYLVKQWFEWTVSGGVSATMWGGVYAYTTATQPYTQSTTYSGVTYGMDVETGWIKPFDLLGQGKFRWFELIGEWRSNHYLHIRMAADYDYDTGPTDPNWFYDQYHSVKTSVNGNVAGKPIDLRADFTRSIKAIKIRITAVDHTAPTEEFPTGEALKLTGIALYVADRSVVGKRLTPPPSAPASG